MEHESDLQAPPTLCRSGCGFYANSFTDGHCSVCFKKAVKEKEQTPSPTISSRSALLNIVPAVSAVPIVECKDVGGACPAVFTALSSCVPEDEDSKKKKKNRCATCRKKVGLTGFECRCGGLYCSLHRYSDKHECSFNYRELGVEEIRRNNPVVVAQKIQKIWMKKIIFFFVWNIA